MCKHLDAVIMPATTERKVKLTARTRVCTPTLKHWLLMDGSLMTSPLNTGMGVTATPLTGACLARVHFDCLPTLSERSAFKHRRPSPFGALLRCCNKQEPACRACRPEPIRGNQNASNIFFTVERSQGR